MSEEPDEASQKIQAMLDVMWKNSREIITERVRSLRAAQHSLVQGALDRIIRKDAESAAHKLSGILGTFGLPQGSVLASKIERVMAQEDGIGQLQQQELAAWLDALEQQINSKDN